MIRRCCVLEGRDTIKLKLFVIGISLLLIIRDIGAISLNKYIYLVYCSIFMVLVGYETIIYMICFLMPLFNGLPGTYILLVALMLMFFKKRCISKIVIILILVYSLLEIIASLWYPQTDLVEIAEYLFVLSTFLLLLYDNSDKDNKLCVKMFFYGTFLFCTVVIISGILTAPSNWMQQFAMGWFRFGETNTGSGDIMMLRGNANELAYFSVVGLSVGLLLLDNLKGLMRILFFIMIICIGISGFLSLSRSWILVALLIVLLYGFSRIRKPKKFLAFGIIFLVVIFLSINYLNKNPYLLNGFLNRFSDSTMRTGGNRTTIAKKQIVAFLQIPRCVFFGTGVTQYTSILNTFSIHNMIIQVFICYGLIFGTIFIVSIIRPIILSKYRIQRLLSWLPLIAVLAFVQTIQFINPYALMLPYVIGIYSLRIKLNYTKCTSSIMVQKA